MKTVVFEIEFDGSTRGLESHRLSLSAFKESLPKLLNAVRFTAQNLNAENIDRRRVRAGQLGNSLDVQIDSIGSGSLVLKLIVLLMPGAADHNEIDTLPERAAAAFVRSIDQETTRPGSSNNIAVTNYLDSLPPGLTTQSYAAVVDGTVVARATVASTLPEPLAETLPRMRIVRAKVNSVAFPRGRERVVVQLDDGTKHSCSATPELVETAIMLRGEEVAATIVFNGDNKQLVALRSASSPLSIPDTDERWKYIKTTWGEVLKRLAE